MTSDDEAVEAVARVLNSRMALGGWPEGLAEAIIFEVDRVCSRPDSGTLDLRALTEGDCLEAARQAIESMRTTGERIPSSGAMALAALTAALDTLPAPSSVSGTEPDTAKLVEALHTIDRMPSTYSIVAAQRVAREALAGFSVDAGKP